MINEEKIFLTKKQAEILELMQKGYLFFTGISGSTGRQYYLVSKGYDNVYFNSRVFQGLLNKNIIYQQHSYPFNYILTNLGKSLEKNKNQLH